LNKFFVLLLIGGLATAYYLLTRPMPPTASDDPATQSTGPGPAADRQARDLATPAAPPETPSTITAVPTEGAASDATSLPETAGEAAINDQDDRRTDETAPEALDGPADAIRFRAIEEAVESSETAEATTPGAAGEALE